MRELESAQVGAIDEWSRRGGALGLAIACWEVFLRLDSRIVAPATKAWLFPLVLVMLTSAGMAVGAIFGWAAVRVVGAARVRRLLRVLMPWAIAIAIALEYALLVFHHHGGRVDARVLALIVAAALVWSLAAGARAPSPAPPVAVAPPLPTLAACAGVAIAAFAFALLRPDVFYALLKRDSALGRALGHSLSPFPPRLAAVAAPPPLPALAPHTPLGIASVVLLSIDTLRADALAPYGAPAERSPRLAALARTAIVFTNAYTQSPNSAPSIATVLTGLYPFHHRVRMNRMQLLETRPRLQEALAHAGYATAGFVTNPHFGDPFEFARGFGTYRYLPATVGGDGLLRDTSDPEAVDAGVAWARAHAGQRFFLWLHVMAPHAPYIAPDDVVPVAPAPFEWFNVWNMPGPEARLAGGRMSFDRSLYAARYATEVESADRLVGRLLDGLAAAGILDDAHVIVLADHGEAFGESDAFGHGRSLDRVETRVPLLWRLPRARRAATVTTAVQLADLMPTLLGVVGVPMPDDRDGRDVGALLLGEAPEDDGFAFTEARYVGSMGVRGLMYAGRTRRRTLWLDAGYPYVCAFDRAHDPEERVRRRAIEDGHDPLYTRLVGLARDAQGALAEPTAKAPIDDATRTRLRALGYVQ